MSHQLWYTSAERGLAAGSRGFCTVKATRGIPQPLAQRLESLSGYTHLFAPQDKGNPANPAAYHFIQLRQGGRTWYVLSRVCDAGLDYSGRTNKFAHHVVLDRDELPPAGPAWLMAQPDFFDPAWDGLVGVVDGHKPVPALDRPPGPCTRWQEAAGDAGWAGVLAESVLDSGGSPVHIIAPLRLSVLPLLEEALALLPPEMRWSATFSTYYTEQFPADVSVRWRVLLEGTREAVRAAAIRHQPVIDLTRPGPLPARLQTPAVEAARKGTFLRPPAAAAGTSRRPVPGPLFDKEGAVYPGAPPAYAASSSAGRAASRPPELEPLDRPAIVPIGNPRTPARGHAVLRMIWIASLPLVLLLGITLGIVVQPLDLLPGVGKLVSHSSAGTQAAGPGSGDSGEKGSSKATQAEQPPDSQSQNPPPQQKGNSPPATGHHVSTGTHASGHPQSGTGSPPGGEPESASPPSGQEKRDSNGEPPPPVLDATAKPEWHVREIPHALSDQIRLGVIENVSAGTTGPSAARESSQDGKVPFDLLIDTERNRLITLAAPRPVEKLRMEPAASVMQGTMPGQGKQQFPLRFALHGPDWVFSALGKPTADVQPKLTIKEIALSTTWTKGANKTPGGPADYISTAPWKTGCTEADSKSRLEFKLKSDGKNPNEQGGEAQQSANTFGCDVDVKVGTDAQSALTVEIHDPVIPAKDYTVNEMKVTRMAGTLEIYIVPKELNGGRIRVVNEQWQYPGQ
ncbi:MAG: hypothetical protein GYA33_17020 [Thermogutta sp.]|nr:hypothetical protein [Thermogutta sp.]